MQLLATTYNNIGPFLDRTLTVHFHKGKYLVKAPIGSGKSFMFFDGPVFGLYKYSSRNMLSIKAKEGYVKALFEAGDAYFLITRAITRTKSGGDSVKSRLFKIDETDAASTISRALASIPDVVNEDLDIEDILRSSGIVIEEESFKNESDLNAVLTSFLPPREVYTSTTFLMQDSENMFEMTPADRINVFKNIFNLLNIDEAKEILADAKKQTSADLKSRRNVDDVNAKLHRLIDDYIENISRNRDWISDDILSHATDWELVKNKLGIENFDIASLPLAARQILAESYDQKRSAFQSMLGKLQALEKQATTISNEIEKNIQQKKKTLNEIELLEKKLHTDHSATIKKLQYEKQSLASSQEAIVQALPLQQLNMSSVYELNSYISELTQKGRMLKQTKELWEQKFSLIEKKLVDITENRNNLEKQLELVDSNDNKQKFICNLIGDKPCPYVDLINSAYAKNITQQKELLTKQLSNLDAGAVQSEKEAIVKELELAQKEYEGAIEAYKRFDFKKIKEEIDRYSEVDQLRQKIDKELLSLEKEKELHEGYKQQHTQLLASLGHYDETAASLEKQLTELNQEISTSREGANITELDKIELILNAIARSIKLLETISDLVVTHKNNMLIIKKLEERETMLNQLFNIFSKEVMIYVLQQTLPLFADVLNNLLAKVVDYTVSFETNTGGEKIELEIKIHDSKGERLVKSLSGGQRTILRLTWTLAICIFTRSNALFLDETVNNIDRDTIGKVADLIEDFTKTHDITFYIITHSEAIQDMEIWDKVISL